MSEAEKQHIVEAFHFEVGNVRSQEIRRRVVEMFSNVSGDLAARIAERIGVPAPMMMGGTGVTASSPALSQENTARSTVGRKVAILAADGFSYSDLMQVKETLQEAGVRVKIVSKYRGVIRSSEGQELEVDHNYVTTGSIMFDAVYIPGGRQSVDTLKRQGDAVHFVNEAFKHAKPIGATNEGVELLEQSDIQGGVMASPQSVAELVADQGVVTIRKATDLSYFGRDFVQAIAQHRHWQRAKQKEMVPA